MIELRPAQQRGYADLGWLQSYHTFSFSNYYDPQQIGFSDLLVINDDRVQAGHGFGMHPHRNMEIFTYVLQGELAHKDTMGKEEVIYAGDVQMMSAGTGVRHSEYNHSDEQVTHLLQIWIVPNKLNVTPRYQQKNFGAADKRGQLKLIISPDPADQAFSVYQDVKVYAGCFDGEEQAQLELAENRYAYIHLARGELTINGTRFTAGDGARVRFETLLKIEQGKDAEVLIFDLRPNELPNI